MAEGQVGGMLNLENELTCSICTDVLYQPLTLLDCLHTFCGACVKEWFALQASRATNSHPYTCPSCRASVRGTTPDARVTTLLEMFLQANPSKGKSEQEREDMRKQYKAGENVMPKVRRQRANDEDRRLMDEIRAVSLQEVGVGSGGLPVPLVNQARSRGESRERRTRTSSGHRARRNADRNPAETYLNYSNQEQRQNGTGHNVPPPARQVEHQSSLRSLLSGSDVDSQDVEEEIMRQIIEEGILDGLDLENIDMAREDEISERIAAAYRRRRRERDRARLTTAENLANRPASSPRRSDGDEQTRRRNNARPDTATTSIAVSSHPPVSRPHLLESVNTGQVRQSRSSSQGSTGRPSRADLRSTMTSSRPATRSTTDLTETGNTTRAVVAERRRLSQHERSITDPEVTRSMASIARQNVENEIARSNPSTPRAETFNSEPERGRETATASSYQRTSGSPSEQHRQNLHRSPPSFAVPFDEPSSNRPASSLSEATTTARRAVFPEPSVSCEHCGKANLEYKLHYNCPRCKGGVYSICLQCYRASKGCLHWYGFGHAAWANYERKAPTGGYPPNSEQPHALTSRRYLRPLRQPVLSMENEQQHQLTEENPSQRLQDGVFCDVCLTFAMTCYWKCDHCNDGAWGYCNNCVNQGRHCTHPLLPLAHKNSEGSISSRSRTVEPTGTALKSTNGMAPSTQHPSTPPLTPKHASMIRGPATLILGNATFRPLTFSANCDICTYPIPPSHTRFHCPRCNEGDYDICTPCYHRLVADGAITPENGHHGWRRCLRGHRMVVIGFEDRGGQRRIVVRDLVGGLSLKDEDDLDPQAAGRLSANTDVQSTPNWSWKDEDGTVKKARSHARSASTPGRFPPDGGAGNHVLMLWGYFPAEDSRDELMFPRGAEVREAYAINEDWSYGSYVGAMGLFPGPYGRTL